MQKLIAVLVSIILLCIGVAYIFPNAKNSIPFREKISSETKAPKGTSEFTPLNGQTFDPRNSNVIQALIGRGGKVSFDGRQWHKETVAGRENLKAIRIMPNDNSADNWTEAIDFIQFSKFNSASTFAEKHKAEILQKHPAAVWRTLKQDSSGIVYDWTVVADKQLGDYTEIGKIMVNDTGVFHAIYLNKHTPNVQKTRTTFLTFLDNL